MVAGRYASFLLINTPLPPPSFSSFFPADNGGQQIKLYESFERRFRLFDLQEIFSQLFVLRIDKEGRKHVFPFFLSLFHPKRTNHNNIGILPPANLFMSVPLLQSDACEVLHGTFPFFPAMQLLTDDSPPPFSFFFSFFPGTSNLWIFARVAPAFEVVDVCLLPRTTVKDWFAFSIPLFLSEYLRP